MSQQINLCNPLFQKQKKYFSALTMMESLGLILLGIFVFYGYLAYQTRALSAQNRQMLQLHDYAKRQLLDLANREKGHKPSQLLADHVAQVEQTVHDQQSILNMLQRGELGNQTGFSPYFIALSHQTVDGLWLTGFGIVGMADQINVRGRALQPELIAKLIQQLKTEPVFSGIHFTMLDIHRPIIADKNIKSADNKPSANNTEASAAPYIEFSLAKTITGQPK